MIQIDGSRGGGQLVRTALSLSAATGKPFTIKNARGQRKQSGLKPQHLAAIKALQQICDADVEGAMSGSTEFSFSPRKIKGGTYTFDIGTAGSSTLLLQTIIPAAVHADAATTVTILGGTDTKWCPPGMHMQHVLLPIVRKAGINVEMTVEKYGFYPKGGGEITAVIRPMQKIKELTLNERGKIQAKEVTACASTALQTKKVAERMISAFLKEMNDPVWKTQQQYVATASPGCFLHAHVNYENYPVGDDALGEKGKSSENVGKECAQKIQTLMNGEGLDEYAADQVMVYLALAGRGRITTAKITDHMRTNAEVIEKFVNVKFSLSNDRITCGPVV